MGYRNRYTHGVKTLIQIDAITDLRPGDTVYCTTNNRKMVYDGDVWMCSDFIKLKNTDTITLNRYDVVVLDTAQQYGVKTTTTADDPLIAGIVIFGGPANAWVAVAYKGVYQCKSATVGGTTIGDYLSTATTPGSGSTSTIQGVGRIGIAVESAAQNVTSSFALHVKGEFF